MSNAIIIQHTDHQKITSILSTEISKDGGACLVRDLKEYNPSIDALLKRCSHINNNTSARRGMKLASFMELYPDVFEVHRLSEPHLVYLISNKYADACDAGHDDDDSILAKKKQVLIEKIVYRINAETNKDFRRNNNKAPGASMSWLLKQCQYPFHAYLRLSGFYQKTYSNCREVQFIGSKDWFGVVLDEFIRFIVQERVGTVLTNDDGYEQRIILKKEDCTDNNNINRDIGNIDINLLAKTLAKKVEEDGGTHITLTLLLHRDDGTIRNLLRGQDLIKLTQEHPECFDSIVNIYQKNNEIILQSNTLPKNTGRLLVDQTGLFSVTSSKWANALITILIRQCKKRLCASLKDDTLLTSFSPKEHVLAIDLTASVGGMTLPLAKTFKKVIAYEMDTVRAKLCQQNMHDYNVAVDIRNEDSIEMLPDLAQELSSSSDKNNWTQQTVVVMDPPWGGMHYKSDERNNSNTPIMMGKWTLVEAVKRVYENLTPAVLALRMPVTFDANGFLSQLKQGEAIIQSHVVKKVGPQMFIVLTI